MEPETVKPIIEKLDIEIFEASADPSGAVKTSEYNIEKIARKINEIIEKLNEN